ncbi:MAG: GNAT family N-acetyltransferase [Butyricimonas faecihominis]
MEITHDKTRHMFEFTENGSSAVVEYKPFDGGINILHTFVPKPLQNKGYGAKLVKETLDYARENHLKVIITCPFARAVAKVIKNTKIYFNAIFLLANTCTSERKTKILQKGVFATEQFSKNIEIYNSILWNIGKI